MLHIGETHPIDEYLALLETSKEIYIDNDRLDKAIKTAQYIADDYKDLALLELRIETGGSYQMLSPQAIIEYLESIGVDFEARFRNRKTQGLSLDMKRVVNPLIEAGIAVDLLTAYKTHRSYKSYASLLAKLYEQKKVYAKTSDGRVILVYGTQIQERENLRVYYHDIAVVGIPKVFSNMITGPSEAWHVAWADFPQADWRFAYNLFIKDDSNFEVMNNCEDSYEGLARIVEGNKFDPNQFKASRKEYKVNCLSTFYNSRDKRAIPTAMREYFRSRAKYARYVFDLNILYNFKLPVPCTSYFGYTQMLPEGKYPDAFISKGLNTPIQTQTSHVVNETVIGILNRFYELGYTEDDIRIYYVRHDEIILLFKDTIIKDAWVFKDCSQIHIDGFTPITLDFHFGNYYTEEDEVLTEEIRRNMDNYPERIHTYPIGQVHDYYPVPPVEAVYVQFFAPGADEMFSKIGVRRYGEPVFNGLDVVYYNYRTHRRICVATVAPDHQEALYSTIDIVLKLLHNPTYLLVRNESMDFMDRLGGKQETLMKVIPKYDSSVAI